jgi:hypothetical protein
MLPILTIWEPLAMNGSISLIRSTGPKKLTSNISLASGSVASAKRDFLRSPVKFRIASSLMDSLKRWF